MIAIDRDTILMWVLLVCSAWLFGCVRSQGITPVQTAFNRGVYQYSQGNYDQAISEYRLAVEENSDDYRAWFNLGVALEANAEVQRKLNRKDQAANLSRQAEQAYRKVIALKPGNLRASVNLAAIEYARGQKNQAKQRLMKLAKLHPQQALPRTALAAHFLAEKNLQQAKTHLQTATRLQPGHLEAQYMLGRTLWRLKDPDGARAAFANALKRDENDVATLVALGELEYTQGRYVEAGVLLKSALYIDSQLQRAHHVLGLTGEKQGDLELAVTHLWQARRLSTDSSQIESYNRKLLSLYQALLDRENTTGQ